MQKMLDAPRGTGERITARLNSALTVDERDEAIYPFGRSVPVEVVAPVPIVRPTMRIKQAMEMITELLTPLKYPNWWSGARRTTRPSSGSRGGHSHQWTRDTCQGMGAGTVVGGGPKAPPHQAAGVPDCATAR